MLDARSQNGFSGRLGYAGQIPGAGSRRKYRCTWFLCGPLAYSQMQVLEQAAIATESLDNELLSEYCRTHTFETVIGSVRFGEGGEWAAPRVIQVQYQNIDNGNVDTFRDSRVHVVVSPSEYASGTLIYPYAR